MKDKIKVKISNNAYNELINLFNYDKNYNCIKFIYNQGCCKEPKVSLILHKEEDEGLLDKVEDVKILYDKELMEKIKEIQLIYTKKGFMVKTTSLENKKDCGGCNSGGCGGCGKSCHH